jgi:hypothetical protein
MVDSLTHGDRLPETPFTPSGLYKVMLLCWSLDPKRRPKFADLMHNLGAIRGAIAVSTDARMTLNEAGTELVFVDDCTRDGYLTIAAANSSNSEKEKEQALSDNVFGEEGSLMETTETSVDIPLMDDAHAPESTLTTAPKAHADSLQLAAGGYPHAAGGYPYAASGYPQATSDKTDCSGGPDYVPDGYAELLTGASAAAAAAAVPNSSATKSRKGAEPGVSGDETVVPGTPVASHEHEYVEDHYPCGPTAPELQAVTAADVSAALLAASHLLAAGAGAAGVALPAATHPASAMPPHAAAAVACNDPIGPRTEVRADDETRL